MESSYPAIRSSTKFYPLLNKSLKIKIQKAHNKCIRFCLYLLPRSRVNPSHFTKLKWLPISGRVEYINGNTTFEY